MRLGVGGEGDSVHEKPRIRESTSRSWWGEIVWNPSSFQHPTCQDVALTSEAQPGTATVRLLLFQLPAWNVVPNLVLHVWCSAHVATQDTAAGGRSLVYGACLDIMFVIWLLLGGLRLGWVWCDARCELFFCLVERCHRAVRKRQCLPSARLHLTAH